VLGVWVSKTSDFLITTRKKAQNENFHKFNANFLKLQKFSINTKKALQQLFYIFYEFFW